MSSINYFRITAICLGLLSYSTSADDVNVSSMAELQKVVANSEPGDVITLADGTYDDGTTLTGKGTKGKPIVVKAENVGGAEIKKGVSIKGDYLSVIGINFTGKGTVRINGTGCRLSRCKFTNVQNGNWVKVEQDSKNIEIDHCLFEDKKINPKMKRGCQLLQVRVYNKNERHHIHHNHFRNIPKGGTGNGFETLQLITHKNPKDPPGGKSNTVIEENLFERCNGEAEIISIKSNGNTIKGNTFRACYGSLVLRHGDGNKALANIFLGDGEKGSGGIRLQGTEQIVANNHFQNLGRAAVAMMDGTPDDLYVRTEKANIVSNWMVNCKYSLEVGLNHSKHPNGTVPKDCFISKNIFYNKDNDSKAIRFVKDDKPENWQWVDNVVFGKLGVSDINGVSAKKLKLWTSTNGLSIPVSSEEKPGQYAPTNYKIGILKIGSVKMKMTLPSPELLTEKDVGPNAGK